MKREKLVITGEENGEIIVGRKNNWDGNFSCDFGDRSQKHFEVEDTNKLYLVRIERLV